jgi:hypothetical protein
MPLLTMSFKHGRSMEEARAGLESAVADTCRRFGGTVRDAEWGTDRSRVKLTGTGFWVEQWVDAVEVHATADAPLLGGFVGNALGPVVKQIVRRAFPKALT